MRVFKVPKKDGDSRFITDATPLNRVQRLPPRCPIPNILELLACLQSFTWFFTFDARNFFFQFPIEDPVTRSYFTIAVNKPRGPPSFFVLRKLCMGWKYSPLIAQTVAITIANRITLEAKRRLQHTFFVTVWIDNFIFACVDRLDACSLLLIARNTFKECNLEVHEPSPITNQIEALGFCIAHSIVKHSPAFSTKFQYLAIELSTSSSLQFIAQLLGCFVWSSYVREIPLAFFPNIIHTMRSLHKRICAGARWSDKWQSAVEPFSAEISSLIDGLSSPFKQPPRKHDVWFELYADAAVDSDSARWGVTSGAYEAQGFSPLHHIFIVELLAAAVAVLTVAREYPESTTLLFTDNLAVMFALRSKHSGNSKGDTILAHLFRQLPSKFIFHVTYVASQFNLADRLTRQDLAKGPGKFASFFPGDQG